MDLEMIKIGRLRKSFKVILVSVLFFSIIYLFGVKKINNYFYCIYFEYIKKNKIKKWFNSESLKFDLENLHHGSAWGYLTADQFKEIILDGISKMDPQINYDAKIFEMGVGVGAALKVIKNSFPNDQLEIGGSDIAENAIDRVKKIFPNESDYFFICDMTQKHNKIPNNYYDHVISFGALGMYLTKDQMIKAMKEALRITKPGGSLLFTHFIAPNGKFVGSIVTAVEISFFEEHAKELGIDNIKIYPMKHQGDRYQVTFSKIKNK